MRNGILPWPLLVLLWASFATAQNPTTCQFSLFTVGDGWTIPNGINDAGSVVGMVMDPFGNVKGFVRSNKGRIVSFVAPNSTGTAFQGVSNSGVVVGWFMDNTPAANSHGLVWYRNQFVIVDFPGSTNTRLNGINSRGQIVGVYKTAFGFDGFLLGDGHFHRIHFPGAEVTWPEAINRFGAIVGAYWAAGIQHGFVLEQGKYEQLDAGAETSLTGVNDQGDIIGVYVSGNTLQSFIFRDARLQSLSVPNADSTGASAINSNDLITGSAKFASGVSGFLGNCGQTGLADPLPGATHRVLLPEKPKRSIAQR